MIGIRYQTMRVWIARGRVEYTKRGGRNFFTPEQVEKMLEVRTPKEASND
jgi:predicted site-specific integrase-resolvase